MSLLRRDQSCLAAEGLPRFQKSFWPVLRGTLWYTLPGAPESVLLLDVNFGECFRDVGCVKTQLFSRRLR